MNPYDERNSSNPWLMDKKSKPAIMGPEGHPLTASYIWSKNGKDREELLEWIFNYYRLNGIKLFQLTPSELKKDFKSLCDKPGKSILQNGVVKNSSISGLKVAKHFSADKFLSARAHGSSSKSFWQAFNDDESFRKILKNRMGWNITIEDGKPRPYVFAINDDMIFQGARSSGIASSISMFKPIIAKFIYERYGINSTIDYSAGWCARAVAAASCGVDYYGIDPFTADEVNLALKMFGSGHCFKECSERFDYDQVPKVDMAFSCPPYFDLEIYEDSPDQSSSYGDFDSWLGKYWRPTVYGCCSRAKMFAVIGVEKVGKINFLESICNTCKECGCEEIERFPISTSASHLSGKAKSGRVSKKTEHLVVYRINH